MTSLCVHGHFYQPPREDPISSVIPDEVGSFPFRNWNEKINAECYRPNAEAGNFERISFNLGPTLFNWLELNDPYTYQLILSQEQNVFTKCGVSNAIAQSYNHSILPLASYRDKMTQIKWGIADYTYQFGHAPMGIWLPETAVDLETLQICSDEGIQFTILAPWQKEDPLSQNNFLYHVNLPGKKIHSSYFYMINH
jgi:alpha-amylase/alpha-mannosidase (GH57 family)